MAHKKQKKMTYDNILKNIVSFYLVSLGDEALAKSASTQTLKQFKKKINRDFKSSGLSDISDERVAFHFVQLTYKFWNKYKNKISDHFFSQFKSWAFKEDPKVWKNFYLNSAPDEFLTLIWSRVLKFSEEQIARGLEITEGTVRYRTGRALKLLGSCQPARKMS